MSTYRGYALKLVLQVKGLEKITRSFQMEIGPVRAVGAPAVLLGLAGMIVAGGAARALSTNAASLAEVVRQTKSLLGGDGPGLAGSEQVRSDSERGSVPLKS